MYAKKLCWAVMALLLCVSLVVVFSASFEKVEGGGFEGWNLSADVEDTDGGGFEGARQEIYVECDDMDLDDTEGLLDQKEGFTEGYEVATESVSNTEAALVRHTTCPSGLG